MKRLSGTTLDRLKPHERYANGRIKNYKDPGTGKVFSSWTIRTERAGGLNPRTLARARKQTGVRSAESKARADADATGATFDYSVAARAWAKMHGQTEQQAYADAKFWKQGIRIMLAWQRNEISAAKVLALFEIRHPRELFWYHY